MARLAPPIACALALLACFVALSLGQTLPPPPIPSHSPGHGYHSHSAPGAAVHVTAFFDFQCPDSRDAWTQWQSVFASLSYAELRFSLVSFALPYHRNAFAASIAAEIVNEIAPIKYWSYVDALFANQSLFYNDPTIDDDYLAIETILYDIAAPLGVNKAEFFELFGSQSVLSPVRADWKAAAASGVYSTPSYIVNGAQLNDCQWDSSTWIRVINDTIMRVEQ
eukprot:TRINITY_DN4005_c0_g1_i1.p1 TRINITY_DN4005_c0_g1~~TRINITY_DN4005_c0_g1_i1.p1  ORF type:complete len:223 (+),score=44.47 TRINITY_DN4005_c0_g1_i1:44-712(+)